MEPAELVEAQLAFADIRNLCQRIKTLEQENCKSAKDVNQVKSELLEEKEKNKILKRKNCQLENVVDCLQTQLVDVNAIILERTGSVPPEDFNEAKETLDKIKSFVEEAIQQLKIFIPDTVASVSWGATVADKVKSFCGMTVIQLQERQGNFPTSSRNLRQEQPRPSSPALSDVLQTGSTNFPVSLLNIKLEPGKAYIPERKHAKDVRFRDAHKCACRCGIKFSKRLSLEKHVWYWNHEVKKFKGLFSCSCGNQFHNRRLLSVHMKTAHGIEQDVNCRICKTTVGTRKQLYAHRQEKHGNKSSAAPKTPPPRVSSKAKSAAKPIPAMRPNRPRPPTKKMKEVTFKDFPSKCGASFASEEERDAHKQDCFGCLCRSNQNPDSDSTEDSDGPPDLECYRDL